MKKNGLDYKLILECGVVALIAAVGVVFVFLFLLGIDVTQANDAAVVGGYSATSGLFWVGLFVRNC